MKFVIVTGGVLSGLGKGITAASIGLLLKSLGLKVTAMKCDMYLNIDAGTMNPVEHGEVFVTHDGLETDQDLGHYERFMGDTLTRANYLTSGQIYRTVLDKERALEYGGTCVEPYYHIPPEIIERMYNAGKSHKADVVVIEFGGTVGEYEGLLFLETVRRLKLQIPKDIALVHVGYLPTPSFLGELKSKPLQQSVTVLHSVGLQPDFIIGRSERAMDERRKEKIAMASGVPIDCIVSNPDVKTIYEVPFMLEKQKLHLKIAKKLGYTLKKKANLKAWSAMVAREKEATKEIKIAMVGKYQRTGNYTLADSYVCVVEALKHASWPFGYSPKLVWIDSEKLESLDQKKISKIFSDIDAIIVPQGWGKRGVEGKIKAAQYARENNIPYLGLCFGMHMATIEFARNVVNLKGANTFEADPKSKYPVIHIMSDQKENLSKQRYGGTIRLGAWPCSVKKGTKLHEAYLKYGNVKNAPWYEESSQHIGSKVKNGLIVHERHRHRYEFNNKYRKRFEDKGFVVSGSSPNGKLVEAIELKNHPFFVATQFHPEYMSRPLAPHPIFISFISTAISLKKSMKKVEN